MADKIFYNGKIHTMAGTVVSAVAVTGNRIEAAGSDDEVLALAGGDCDKYDLEGRVMLPGFNDTHCHVVLTGLEYAKVDLHGVRSVEEMIERGRKYIAENNIPEGTWVQGFGYDHNVFDDPRYPDRDDLDKISDKHPIMYERVCGHIGTGNTLALKECGYDESTEITGGVIDKDETGRINGIMREAALDTFKQRIRKPSVDELSEAILKAFKEANSYGLTSMQTDDLEGGPLENIMAAYHKLEESGQATVRIWEEVQAARIPILNKFLEKGLRTGDGNRFFKIGNIKLLTDGSLGARTAYLREDYSDDPGNRGVAVYTQQELDDVVIAAHKAGMQIACHAIGDGAITQCIHALGAAYKSDGKIFRDRIVHCQFADDAMLDEIAANNIYADIQPPFVPSDFTLTRSRLGDRENYGYVWKKMLDKGIHCGGGSDTPVERFDPIWGIHCAVNRTDADGNPEGGWHPEEKLSVQEAVELYTRNGAYFSFEENEKGTIEPGKLADLTVLDQDIFNIDPKDIQKTKIVMTVMDGNIVYTA